MIARVLQDRLLKVAGEFPVVTVTGPRQSGKTTLCRTLFSGHHYINLELPDQRIFAKDDPRGLLEQYGDGAILDEVQHVPELMSYIQGEVDENRTPGRFILTGSVHFSLVETITQSLAGRSAMLHLLPLSLREIKRAKHTPNSLVQLLRWGGYPELYQREMDRREWYGAYVASYVERDLRQLLNVADLSAFQRFLGLCAGNAGQTLDKKRLATDTGVTHNTVSDWIAKLEASFIVFLARPWHANIRKRLVKRPKLYFYDTGMLCYLLGIHRAEHLSRHPLRGAVFENWVMTEALKARVHQGAEERLSFYRDQSQLEVDLVLQSGDRLLLAEAKSGQTLAPHFFSSMNKLQQILDIPEERCHKVLVYGGRFRERRHNVEVYPWLEADEIDWTLGEFNS